MSALLSEHVGPIAKSLLAFAIAFAGAAATAAASGGVITAAEWWLTVSTGLVAGGGVWGIPNGERPATDVYTDAGPTDDTYTY